MKYAPVKFDELLDAFEFASFGQPFEARVFLCFETGAFHYDADFEDLEELPDDIEDAGRYIMIPHKNHLDLGTNLVFKFVEEVMPDELNDVLHIFRRKGAYTRFKDLLERRRMLEEWYAYEEKSKREALRQWCGDNGIEVHD